jgi:hypothetical protein
MSAFWWGGANKFNPRPLLFNLIEYKRLKKEVAISNSQSCTGTIKMIFH